MEKLARFCTTFAMRVSVRDVCSSGYSWVRLKSDGDMMAGHRKRRKREPLMRRSAMSSRPLSAQRTLQEANTSLSSRGKTLRRGYTAGSDTNWRRLSDSLQLPGEESEVSSIFKVAERNKHTVCLIFYFFFASGNYLPMGVNDLAECQFTAHSEIGLVVWEHRGWCSHGVHFAIFLWLIRGPYELPCKWHFISHRVTARR